MSEIRFDPATLPQIEASFPERTSWVSANAGSGKTRVLTSRVARLLLRGIQPQKILCLTFTKAAASNMVNRLIEILGKWSMLADQELIEKLLELGEQKESLTPERLSLARSLFASALETPGGMKIQTIHSFATQLLRNFPLEAGLSPQFTILDDRKCAEIHVEILNAMTQEHEDFIGEVGNHAGFQEILKLCESVCFHRDRIPENVAKEPIWKRFSVPLDWEETKFETLFQPNDRLLLKRLVSILENGSIREQGMYKKLQDFDFENPNAKMAKVIEDIFLYGSQTKQPFQKKSVLTKDTMAKLEGDFLTSLDEYGERVQEYCCNQRNYHGAKKTYTLYNFARIFLDHYKAIKDKNAWVDYDDLLRKSLAILSDPEISPWILFRLDERIDHILVDEAQDTSPIQWEIVEKLAEEFTAGHGQKENTYRTVFAVGDEKQSIYGFQGAEPERFQIMRDYFQEKFTDFDQQQLAYSFRSSKAILDVVDKVFSIVKMDCIEGETKHIAFKEKLPGRVDIWPQIKSERTSIEVEWQTKDYVTQDTSVETELAKKIVKKIKTMLDYESIPQKDGNGHRPIEPKDILILVSRRAKIYECIIEELQSAGLPTAGTDRMNLIEDLAVRDLLALLEFLSLPKNNLSLASALKSPMFGFDEQDIFSLMYNHSHSLWDELQRKAEDNPKYSTANKILNDLLSKVDKQTPYGLLEEMLSIHGGRKLLKGRLGDRCDDAIDTLLIQALDFEKTEVISLTHFLEWLSAERISFKRELSHNNNEIRVMTIHGAKGLESPIVILPDTGKRPLNPMDQILVSEDKFPIWKTSQSYTSTLQKQIIDWIKQKNLQERHRLLYVAMTRAENWLIICGIDSGESKEENNPSWYSIINRAFLQLNAPTVDILTEITHGEALQGNRYSIHDWPDSNPEKRTDWNQKLEDLPEWMKCSVEAEKFDPISIPPSKLGGAKVVASAISENEFDQEDEFATEKGTAIHLLLEVLPLHPLSQRLSVAKNILALKHPTQSGHHSDWIREAMDNLQQDHLQMLFTPSTMTEVAIAATVDGIGTKPIYGFIDRLVFKENSILAVDYKTNQITPSKVEDVPEGLLRQMEAYRMGLKKIYPSKTIETAILWTQTKELMYLPEELTEKVLLSMGPIEEVLTIH